MSSEREVVQFERIYDAHYESVLRYCLRRIEADGASDAAAETFAVAWRRRSDLPWDRPLPWLYGIAWRVLANMRRTDRRWKKVLAHAEGTVWRMPSPDAAVLVDEEHREVLDALSHLRPSDQEILLLSNWEQLSRGELAVALGCSENAVSKRLRRALDRLASAMGASRPVGSRFFTGERSQR